MFASAESASEPRKETENDLMDVARRDEYELSVGCMLDRLLYGVYKMYVRAVLLVCICGVCGDVVSFYS